MGTSLKGLSAIPDRIRKLIFARLYKILGSRVPLLLPIPASGLRLIRCRCRYQLPHQGFNAGIKLWLISTVINALIAVIIGTASLGLTVLLGLPYMLLCGPVFLVGSGLGGWFGGWLSKNYHQRTYLSDDLIE